MYYTLLLLLTLCLATDIQAQDRARPAPYPVTPPPAFERAIAAGTRTPTGAPGPDYWNNTARYEIRATLSPKTKRVRGEAIVYYANHSPDTLHQLVVHLRQNIYKGGSVRNTALEVTGGMDLTRVAVEGMDLIEHAANAARVGYSIENTVMTITPAAPVLPGASVRLDFSWGFKVRSEGPAPREGTDGEVFYIGYWYPQMAVYDDVQGWDRDPFRQWAEFYMDHADYDVRITVPAGWLVAATGTLQNAGEVLTPRVQERLARAARSTEPVSIVGAEERQAGTSTVTSASDQLTWHFQADRVRDFAFGTSDRYVWDAVATPVGDADGDARPDTVMAHALYRPEASAWGRAATFTQFAVSFFSDLLIPYPYPQMTCVEGVVGGGMEYPMITIVGPRTVERSVFRVAAHEISHMWFPMIVGSQETDYTWMDEGLTTYNTREAVAAFWPDADPWAPSGGYFNFAGTGGETEIMRHGDRYPSVGTLVAASYDKTGRALYALRGLFGAERFHEAYRAYARRWAFKQPYPYDLFNTFEDVLQEDLDWFWRGLFYETWTLDQAVSGVERNAEAVTVRIEDHGLTPMPVLLRVTYVDGSVVEERIPVAHWLNGADTAAATFPAGDVARVEIDPEHFLPDVQRANNVWTSAVTRTGR